MDQLGKYVQLITSFIWFKPERNHRNIGCWQAPPDEIMEKILHNMGTVTRTRLTKVCMSWQSVAMRPHIRNAPQLPWLIHPQTLDTNFLTFSSLSDGEVVKLEFPKQLGKRDFTFRACSKGWLILFEDDKEMILFNPITRTQYSLPCLETVPSFRKKEQTWKDTMAEYFVTKIVLSSPNISECIVAAVFGSGGKELGLCRPGDRSWTVFEILQNESDSLVDLLFSSGMLYGLVNRIGHENLIEQSSVTSAALSFNSGSDDQQPSAIKVEVKLVYNDDRDIEKGNATQLHTNYQIDLNEEYNSYLSESAANGGNKVLLIHQMLDRYWTGDYDAEYHSTTCFRVYEIDRENGSLRCQVNNLGDQVIFLATDSSSLSFSASEFELQENCIYFATCGYYSPSPHDITREIGVYSLETGKIIRCFPSFHCGDVSIPCRPCWFTPSF